jgi:hypothetical protein
MSDILADYREWRDAQPGALKTHSDRCHMWHRDCMIHRLAAALERARLTDAAAISGAGKSAPAANTPPEPSPASAGYAGGWEPIAGDTVRVKNPDQFVSPLDKQFKDRDGVVLRVWTPLGLRRRRATVRFGKRNGRGKEFEHSLSVGDLMLWPKKDA